MLFSCVGKESQHVMCHHTSPSCLFLVNNYFPLTESCIVCSSYECICSKCCCRPPLCNLLTLNWMHHTSVSAAWRYHLFMCCSKLGAPNRTWFVYVHIYVQDIDQMVFKCQKSLFYIFLKCTCSDILLISIDKY